MWNFASMRNFFVTKNNKHWNKIKVFAKTDTEFGIVSDKDGVLSLVVKSDGEDWPHDMVPTDGENKIGEGSTCYIVVGDEEESRKSSEAAYTATDLYFVNVSYQTNYCDCYNTYCYTTNEKCFDKIARQALKKYKRAHAIELRKNSGDHQLIHYWTLDHEDNPCQQLTENDCELFKWYEKEIPNGEWKLATFK